MRQALSLLVFCVLASRIFASTTLPTALKPVTIIRQNDIVHVFTSAVDVDYDGTKDVGDRNATWQIIDIATLTTQRTLEFQWTTVNAPRPWLSVAMNRMLIGVGDSVFAFEAMTQQRSSSWYLAPSSGVYYDEEGAAIYSTERVSFTAPGVLHAFSFLTGLISSVPVGVNPQQIAGYRSTANGRNVAVINEGQFGQNDGTLMLIPTAGTPTVIPVGDTPNHVFISGDSAYVTVNGSHFVVVVDLNLESAVDTILVGTSGSNGPRESTIKDGRLFVSTYVGDVRIFDIATGARTGYILHGPKAEGLAIVNNQLWVTRAMNENYGADSGIVVYDLNVATSVPWDVFSERGPLGPSPLTVAPSVAGNEIEVMGIHGNEPVVFIDGDGRVTSAPLLSSGPSSATFDVTSLVPSSYTCIQGAKRGRFVIIR